MLLKKCKFLLKWSVLGVSKQGVWMEGRRGERRGWGMVEGGESGEGEKSAIRIKGVLNMKVLSM